MVWKQNKTGLLPLLEAQDIFSGGGKETSKGERGNDRSEKTNVRMAERRAKQAAFEKARKEKQDSINSIDLTTVVNPDRQLHIITWGTKHHGYSKPPSSEKNFDAGNLTFQKECRAINLNHARGDQDPLYFAITQTSRCQQFIKNMVRMIEDENLHVISINCAHGRHRSRAICRAVCALYPLSSFEHLDA